MPPQTPVFPVGDSIPQIIHQTSRSQTLRPDVQASIELLRADNPGYDYRFYDDDAAESFISKAYGPEMLAAFGRIHPAYGAAKADLFRYLLMYKEGGVYLDIKSTASRPLSNTIKPGDKYILSQWNNAPGEEYPGWGLNSWLRDVPGGEFQQWHIISIAGHPFLRAVIIDVLQNMKSYRAWRQGVGLNGTVRTFGPVAYTNAIYPILNAHPHRRVKSERELGLRYTSSTDRFAHRNFEKTYYRTNLAPVVRINPLVDGFGTAFAFGEKAFKKALRR